MLMKHILIIIFLVRNFLEHFFYKKANYIFLRYVHNLLGLFLIIALFNFISPEIKSQSREAEFQAKRIQAEKLEAKNQFYKAIEIWQRILHENPNNSQAYLGIAHSYMRLGRYREALDFVDQALLLANQNDQVRVLKSRILMGLRQYDEAKNILLELKKENTTGYQVDLALAELFAVLGDLASSVEYLNTMKGFSSNNLNFLLTSLMIYEEANNLDQADRYLQQALDSYYNEIVVHKVAAGYYLRRGHYGKVLKEIEIIKRLGVDTEELRAQGLEAAYLKGDYQLAVNLAKTLTELYPKNFRGWYILGLAYSNIEQLEEALNALNTARRIDPNDELVQIIIAEILRTRYPYPSEWHKQEAINYIADAEIKRKDLLYEEALQNYRFALQIDPLNQNNWMAFANKFRDKGNYAKFLEKLYAWRQFTVSPNNPQDGEQLKEEPLGQLIRLYEASQPQSVAQKWNLNQYSHTNNFYPTQIFVLKGNNFEYLEAAEELGSYFVNILQWFEQPFIIGELQTTADQLQAQQSAQGKFSDYYITLDFTRKNSKSFRVEVELFLSSTGRKITGYIIEQVTNEKIYRSFAYLAKQLYGLFPKRATILETTDQQAVISLGSLDNIEEQQEWLVLPNDALSQSIDKPFGEYEDSQITGTLTIEDVDEKVSEGKIQLRSFIKPAKKGYIALQLQKTNKIEEQQTEDAKTKTTKQFLQEPNINLQNRLFELS